MRIAKIESCALAEFDDSITSVVFFQGCDSNCKYCQNPQLIEKDGGEEKRWQDVILELQLNYVDWVSLTGGEVLAQDDEDGILKLCMAAKEYKPSLKINIDMSSNATLSKGLFLARLAPHLDCITIGVKDWSRRHLENLMTALAMAGIDRKKCRYCTVVVDSFDLDNQLALDMLAAGMRDVRILPNSGQGRGKNLPATSTKLVEDMQQFYAPCGIDFHL